MGKNIVWFSEVTREDVALAGGKGASLGEMAHAHIPVPPGFIVIADAYSRFLEEAEIIPTIRDLLDKIDFTDSTQLIDIATQIQNVIIGSKIPDDIAKDIEFAYEQMGDGAVAVRSSATAEDSPDISFAGQHSTFLNVIGGKEVVEAVRKCWASIFEPRAIAYRYQNDIDHLEIKMAVPVQKMIQPRVSGVMFTVEPVLKDKDQILLEAVYGLGEALVSGEVTPDEYIVNKKSLGIMEKSVVPQKTEIVRNTMPWRTADTANIKIEVAKDRQNKQKLSDDKIKSVAQLGRDLEELYGFPVDIEWAMENDDVYVIQTRPITTL